MAKKVLFAGESWMAVQTETKGFNSFSAAKYETGLGWIDKAIEKAGYELTYMPNHIANDSFPFTIEELQEYDCIVLSDIGADTLPIPSETFSSGKMFPNRCQLLKEYVLQGGALLMFGGYMTFNGIGGQGKWWEHQYRMYFRYSFFRMMTEWNIVKGLSRKQFWQIIRF